MALLEYKLPDRGTFAVLGEFGSPRELIHGCERVRDAGYTRWDAHSPFPVHGIERAMGMRPTKLPWFVLAGGLGGAAGGYTLQWWVHTLAYPLVISGKPSDASAWPAYLPITFELGVLLGAAAAVMALFGLSQLPTLYHPLFHSKRFERVSDDRFFISIESWDPKFDARQAESLLRESGARHVELVDV